MGVLEIGARFRGCPGIRVKSGGKTVGVLELFP